MTWWNRVWRRNTMEEQLAKELRFHLENHAADLIAQGCAPEDARRRARLALGGQEQVTEGCRDARGTRWLDDTLQDTRYAVRTLRQKPEFSAVALLTLALGIGATTVMFTVVNGVLLKPLPYHDPDRLVRLQEKTDWRTQFGDLWAFSYPNFLDARRESRFLAPLVGVRSSSGTVSQPGQAQYVVGRQISAELFSVVGVDLFKGRAFTPEDDRPGAAPVAIVSYDLWQQRFGGNADAIGMPLVFNGQPYTVVGITPSGFRLADEEVGVFTPLGQDAGPGMQNRDAHSLRVWARLRPGATLVQAQAELTEIGRHLAEQYPASNKGRGFVAETLRPAVEDVRSTLWLLLGAVTLVLLIACSNIASLLLARAVARDRELAMRAALGAGRGRLVRQCLTESAVLGLFGGALGVVLAAVTIQPFVAFWPGSLPRAREISLDWHVLLFAVAASLASGAVFGLAPALRAPALDLEKSLRHGARTVTGGARRLHRAFVVAEIALAMVLLVSAGMLGRTLLRLYSLDSGVNIKNILTSRMALAPATLASPAKIRAAWLDVLDRARQVPGVQSISMVDTVPMREGSNSIRYGVTPAPPSENDQRLVLASSVTPDYLKVMGIPLLKGRFVDDEDVLANQSVAVIDDVMAQQAFGGQDPIGKHLWIGLGADPVTVVGIVAHVRYWGPAADDQANVRAQLYYPFAQVPDRLLRRWSELMSIAVRTNTEPMSVAEPLKRAVRGVANDQVLYQVRTMEDLASAKLAQQRFLLLLFGIFAGLALLLACVGIYGVLAYLTRQRVPEIGVRLALGASARNVMWMVLRESLDMILLGVGAGVLGAWAAARLLIRLVEGVRSADLSTFALMTLVLIAAALVASLLPARGASRLDPMRALRQE
jgi:predicted permease